MTGTVRNAIVTTLLGVPGIGVVHNRERYADRQAEFRTLYMHAPDNVNGWFVRFEGRNESEESVGRHLVVVRWRLQGFYGFDDAAGSEVAFVALVEAAAAAFRADPTLGGAALDTLASGSGESGLQVDAVEPVMFGGILCHRAACRLTTRSLV